jgi:DNA-binding NtrC family response regulator
MERAVLLCRNSELCAGDLNIRNGHRTQTNHDDLPMMTLEQAEKRLITQAMHEVDQHVPKAATLLGLTKSSLYRRLEKYVDIQK